MTDVLRRAATGSGRFVRDRWTGGITMLAGLFLLVAALTLIARTVSTSWQPQIIAGSLLHPLLWTGPVALVLFLIARKWWAAGIALAVAALAVISQVGLYVAQTPPRTGTDVRVLQANLAVGKADPAKLVALARDRKIDIAATEELTTAESGRLTKAGLEKSLPYTYLAPLPDGGGGLGIWSRYPLSDVQNYPGFRLGVLSARVALPSGPVRFVAVHLTPPYPSPSGQWADEIKKLGNLLTNLSGGHEPVVVAGDFNATPDNEQFRSLTDYDYDDAADASGAGYLGTYPTDRWFGPRLMIDHVLGGAGAFPVKLAAVGLPGSDHRGLVATMRITGSS